MSQNNLTATQLSPDYKLGIPTPLQYILFVGIGSGIGGLVLIFLTPGRLQILAAVLLAVGGITLVPSIILLLVTNNRARLTARSKIMNTVKWRGDEKVLDVGCGNGFLIIEAAKHLTTGKAIGIDIWQSHAGQQSGEAGWHNAKIEGVTDRVDFQTVDARTMPFENESFDVIVSSLALHHMEGLDQALQEMIRVLKPGGRILIYDMLPFINRAAKTMRQHGFREVKKRGGLWMVVLSASK